jgi:hypothetical protein
MTEKALIRIVLVAGILILILYLAEPDIHLFDMPPPLRNIVWIVFIIAGLLLLVQYVQYAKRPFGGPPPPPREQVQSEAISGLVLDYGSNGIGDVDKLLLQLPGRKIWVRFPPHTASRVMNIGVKTTSVTITMAPSDKFSPDSLAVFELLSIHSASLGQGVLIRDMPPPPPEKGSEVEVTGHDPQFRLDDHGKVGAFILGDKIVELRPGIGGSLIPLLQQAKEITIKGYERGTERGFVNSYGLAVVKPNSILIDKTSYLLP